MALPPKGDLRRPMHLAIRSMWVLGTLLVLLGLCGVGSSLMFASRGGQMRGLVAFQVIGAMFYWVPGIGYMVFAFYLQRRRFWAVVGGLVLASIQFLFLLMGFVVALVLLPRGPFRPTRPFVIVIGVIAIFALALGQLVYHLARSFQAIQQPPYGREDRGFEPIGVRPVLNQPPPGNLPIVTGTTPGGDLDGTSHPR